jgi:hypothetical protein
MPNIPTLLPSSLQLEDLFLFVWFALVEPLLYKLFGGLLGDVQPWDIGAHPNAALGVLFLLAVVGGLIVVATRAPGPGGNELDSGSVYSFAHLPMLVTLGYFMMYGFSAFGGDLPFSLLCGLFVFYLAVGMVSNRLPVVPIPARRVLITPMIILGSWNFSTLMRAFFKGFDLGALLNTPALRDPNSSFTFTLGLLFAAVVFFYLVFIFAPRQIAYPGGSGGDWVARFAVYIMALVLNLGWLPLL